ncbi:hypothetical protein K438DRAFT_1765591 [Mycena galopus ATCC 62051]|nr:hypothetical protein K438DRAFT_1765591 [Mycena galopus ATCC 62051]
MEIIVPCMLGGPGSLGMRTVSVGESFDDGSDVALGVLGGSVALGAGAIEAAFSAEETAAGGEIFVLVSMCDGRSHGIDCDAGGGGGWAFGMNGQCRGGVCMRAKKDRFVNFCFDRESSNGERRVQAPCKASDAAAASTSYPSSNLTPSAKCPVSRVRRLDKSFLVHCNTVTVSCQTTVDSPGWGCGVVQNAHSDHHMEMAEHYGKELSRI